MNMRPFGADGEPPGTSMRPGRMPDPIAGIAGIPGGTIMRPLPVVGTRVRGPAPFMAGVSSRVSRDTVLKMVAINGRGAGPAGSVVPRHGVSVGTAQSGVSTGHSLLGAIVNADIRNPYVARHVLRAGMVAGSTRIR